MYYKYQKRVTKRCIKCKKSLSNRDEGAPRWSADTSEASAAWRSAQRGQPPPAVVPLNLDTCLLSAVFSSTPPLCCDRLSQSVSHTHPGTPHPHPSSFPPPSHPTLPHPPPPPLLLLASEKTTEWESMAQRPAWQDNKPQRRGEFFFPLLVVFFELRN